MWRVARHLKEIYRALCAEHHPRAQLQCEELLVVDPGYLFALELRSLAQRLAHMRYSRRNLIRWLELWGAATDSSSDDPMVPQAESLLPAGDSAELGRWLDDCWDSRPKGISGGSMYHEDYEEEAALFRRLENEIFSLRLPPSSLYEILDALREKTGLNLHCGTDAEGWIWTARWAPVLVEGLTLEEGMSEALEPFGLRVTVQEGVVMLVSR